MVCPSRMCFYSAWWVSDMRTKMMGEGRLNTDEQ